MLYDSRRVLPVPVPVQSTFGRLAASGAEEARDLIRCGESEEECSINLGRPSPFLGSIITQGPSRGLNITPLSGLHNRRSTWIGLTCKKKTEIIRIFSNQKVHKIPTIITNFLGLLVFSLTLTLASSLITIMLQSFFHLKRISNNSTALIVIVSITKGYGL